jgi:uncharacterized repeat protein (TIGR01451 family)
MTNNLPALLRTFAYTVGFASIALFTGCQTAPEPTATSTEPAPRFAPMTSSTTVPAPMMASSDGTTSVANINSDLYTLTKSVRRQVVVGQPFDYVYTLTAKTALKNVVVTDEVPSGATLVSTSPTADSRGSSFAFPIGELAAGESRTLTATMRANSVGTLVNCATVTAIPAACTTVTVRDTVKVGEGATFTITVRNEGTAVAENVVLNDRLPAGLRTADGSSTVSFPAGSLAVGESRTFNLPVTTTTKGRFCNVVEGVASNVVPDANDNAEACITVLEPGLSVEKSGTPEQFINRNATYNIVVTNTGETTLSPVEVVDAVPAGNVIVNAGGGSVSGNNISWTIPSLAAGARETFTIVVTNRTAGQTCNSVTASAPADRLTDSAQACTVWRGVAGVLVELVDDPDPIQVGETTTMTVRITNQGNADLTNVRAVASLSSELAVVSTSAGAQSERRVEFPAIPVLASKAVVTYTFVVRGTGEGDARTRLSVETNETRSPITEDESTTVY